MLADARAQGIATIELRVADTVGHWHHLSLPLNQIDVAELEAGVAFSEASWGEMGTRLVLLPETAVLDPFIEEPTLVVLCEAKLDDLSPHPSCVRSMLGRAVEFWNTQRRELNVTHSADFQCWVFDDVRFECGNHQSSYFVDISQASWNASRDELPNLGHKSQRSRRNAVSSPQDHLVDLRHEIARLLAAVGVRVTSHTCGEHGPGHLRFSIAPMQSIELADAWMWFRHVAKNSAARASRSATFLPKPFAHLAALRLPVRWHLDPSEPDAATVGAVCREITHSLCRWSPATMAFACPTANSYRKGSAAAINLNADGACDESPLVVLDRTGRNFTWSQADTSCNLYIALSIAMIAASSATQVDVSLPAESAQLPESIEAALAAVGQIEEVAINSGTCGGRWWASWYRIVENQQVARYRGYPHPMDFVVSYDT